MVVVGGRPHRDPARARARPARDARPAPAGAGAGGRPGGRPAAVSGDIRAAPRAALRERRAVRPWTRRAPRPYGRAPAMAEPLRITEDDRHREAERAPAPPSRRRIPCWPSRPRRATRRWRAPCCSATPPWPRRRRRSILPGLNTPLDPGIMAGLDKRQKEVQGIVRAWIVDHDGRGPGPRGLRRLAARGDRPGAHERQGGDRARAGDGRQDRPVGHAADDDRRRIGSSSATRSSRPSCATRWGSCRRS